MARHWRDPHTASPPPLESLRWDPRKGRYSRTRYGLAFWAWIGGTYLALAALKAHWGL